ncbi:MAG: hypothetical protein ACP5D4_01695 [Baaleninema sp.]
MAIAHLFHRPRQNALGTDGKPPVTHLLLSFCYRQLANCHTIARSSTPILDRI